MSEIKVEDLSDYPAIKKLTSALHRFGASRHGAAIMVGAGFSRSAARHVGGTKKMPLWADLTQKLMAILNPNPSDSNRSFPDPLRVAEEYRAYCGQAALNDQIRSTINDEAWHAGELHNTLLGLPWSEVMTTNWDTLLERAAEDIDGLYYNIVTKPSDLTWALSPRIVKLHGSIGVTDSFIASEEDYRTYPEKFAAFVNFARQVFIEKELCLLGFSGDDPNFLHWAGWIRDHLANHARKIYLVGALNLTVARRKYLESINIAPIDLWDAVKHIEDEDLRHLRATELFLQEMEDKSKKPHEWQPCALPDIQSSETDPSRPFKEQLATLQQNRESYPGWLVCPPDLRWQVTVRLQLNAKNIATLSFAERSQLLYEIAWRYNISFNYIGSCDSWLVKQLFELANADTAIGINKRQQMEIALVLLKNSRWLDADEENKQAIQEHIEALTKLLQEHDQYLPDCAAELAYHQALVARDALDYKQMEELVERIAGGDPVWKLRRAALYLELGRFDEGKQLIAIAYGELRDNHRCDERSIPILSRLVWAHFLLKATYRGDFNNQEPEELPPFADNQYRKWKCDPWTCIENLRKEIRKQRDSYLKSQNPIEPLFEQGHYRDHSSPHSFNSDQTRVFLLLDGVSRSVGIPLRFAGQPVKVDMLAGDAERLVLAGGIGVELWDFTMAIRAASDENSPAIKNFFTRIGVAKASQGAVEDMVSRINTAIEFWREKLSHAMAKQPWRAESAPRVLIEVLARLVVRLSADKAKEAFQLAVTLGKNDLRHPSFCTVLNSLLTHSLNSIPKSEQGELLLDALEFPLPSEIKTNDNYWPKPVIEHPNARDTYPNLGKRIDELISSVTSNGLESSAAALLRLLPLCEKEGFLTPEERDKLAQVLWGTDPSYQDLPKVADLSPHVFLLLPAPDAKRVEALLSRYFYDHDEAVLNNTMKELNSCLFSDINEAVMIYQGMAAAAQLELLHPTSEQALSLFERLVEWRPPPTRSPFDGFFVGQRTQLLNSIGHALSYAIVPALSDGAINKDNFEKLKQFYQKIEGAYTALPAFVYFVTIDKDIANSVEDIIRKSLRSRTQSEVGFAAIAVHKWMTLETASSLPQFEHLISRLVTIIGSGQSVHLGQLLWVAGELLKNKRLSKEQISILIEVIPEIFDSNDYQNINPESEKAISVSIVREACTKIAKMLLDAHPDENPKRTALVNLLESAKIDVLPEVRFAVD